MEANKTGDLRGSRFWEIAEQMKRDARAAAQGLRWNASTGRWDSIAATNVPMQPAQVQQYMEMDTIPVNVSGAASSMASVIPQSFTQDISIMGYQFPAWMLGVAVLGAIVFVSRGK